MNALTRAASTTIPRATRSMSTRQVIDNIKNKPIWFNDISTYPVIGICVGACVFAGAFIGYKFTTCPDVTVDKAKRSSIIRYW